MGIGNPNHPVTQSLEHQWHKLCAILMLKSGITTFEITEEDLEEFAASEVKNICADCRGGRFVLRLMTDDEANRLARLQGGLPT